MWSDNSSAAEAFESRRERRLIRRALRDAGIDAPVHYDAVTTSTNDVAAELADRGEPEWTLVAAGHQTSGRGRLGRTWTSGASGSLLFSFVLRPAMDPERALLLTLLAGAAMAQSCREASGLDVRCKWPNDLVVPEGKVGGILAEARVRDGELQHAVIGIGLNLETAPEGVEGAAGLGGADRSAVLAGFFSRFRRRYLPEGEGFAETVVTTYREVSDTIGRRVRATTVDGRTVEGTALDLDGAGNLVLETEDGRATVGFGEVQHLR